MGHYKFKGSENWMVCKRSLVLCIATIIFTCSMSSLASAHIMNQNNTFNDVAYSEVADRIVFLAALQIVSAVEDDSYKPLQTLTMKQLGTWLANYHQLQGETNEELANIAFQKGLIASLDGEATYATVNEAYFNNEVEIQNPEATLNHEQFAQFIVANLTEEMVERSDLLAGPSGVVEAAETIEQEVDGNVKKINVITVAGKQYALTSHPYVIAASTDPAVWVGQKLAESYFSQMESSDYQALQLLVIGDEPIMLDNLEQNTDMTIEETLQQVTADMQGEQNRSVMPYILGVVACIAIVTAVVLRRKK